MYVYIHKKEMKYMICVCVCVSWCYSLNVECLLEAHVLELVVPNGEHCLELS